MYSKADRGDNRQDANKMTAEINFHLIKSNIIYKIC
jgi:hypothetical protein